MTQRILISLLKIAGLMLGLTSAQAADKMHYDEIPVLLGNAVKAPGIRVVTVGGKTYKGDHLEYFPDHVRITPRDRAGVSIDRNEVARITFRKSARFYQYILDSARIPFLPEVFACGLETDSSACFAKAAVIFSPLTAVLSPVWAYTAASAPFFLAADGVRLLLPRKVYEIVPDQH